MLGWLRRRRQYRQFVATEANELMAGNGQRAYYVARDLMLLAREKGDSRAERHMCKVALEIARRTGKEVGLDTATRMAER